MSTPVIRPLVPDDVTEFYQLRLRALQEEPDLFITTLAEWEARSMPSVEKRLRHSITSHSELMIGAFIDNQLVGKVGFQRFQRTKLRHKGFIWGMYIAPEFRNQGVGSEMLEFIVRMAAGMEGLSQIQLSVLVPNEPAIKIYERLGFEGYGTEKSAIMSNGKPIDEHHMTLYLTT